VLSRAQAVNVTSFDVTGLSFHAFEDATLDDLKNLTTASMVSARCPG
jgi:hypothetical protein